MKTKWLMVSVFFIYIFTGCRAYEPQYAPAQEEPIEESTFSHFSHREFSYIQELGFVFEPAEYNIPIIERAPMIALTFDDGPAPPTEHILDLLERYNAIATFFVYGEKISRRESTVLRAFEMGNEIANHTWGHPRLTTLSREQIKNELLRTCAAIEALVGYSPPIFRPPFGATDDDVVAVAYELGYTIVKWTLDPLDWRYRDADIIYSFIMEHVQDGSIILAHDTHPTTAEAMGRVIPRLVREGFKFVTVSELLKYFYDGFEPGRIIGDNVVLS